MSFKYISSPKELFQGQSNNNNHINNNTNSWLKSYNSVSKSSRQMRSGLDLQNLNKNQVKGDSSLEISINEYDSQFNESKKSENVNNKYENKNDDQNKDQQQNSVVIQTNISGNGENNNNNQIQSDMNGSKQEKKKKQQSDNNINSQQFDNSIYSDLKSRDLLEIQKTYNNLGDNNFNDQKLGNNNQTDIISKFTQKENLSHLSLGSGAEQEKERLKKAKKIFSMQTQDLVIKETQQENFTSPIWDKLNRKSSQIYEIDDYGNKYEDIQQYDDDNNYNFQNFPKIKQENEELEDINLNNSSGQEKQQKLKFNYNSEIIQKNGESKEDFNLRNEDNSNIGLLLNNSQSVKKTPDIQYNEKEQQLLFQQGSYFPSIQLEGPKSQLNRNQLKQSQYQKYLSYGYNNNQKIKENYAFNLNSTQIPQFDKNQWEKSNNNNFAHNINLNQNLNNFSGSSVFLGQGLASSQQLVGQPNDEIISRKSAKFKGPQDIRNRQLSKPNFNGKKSQQILQKQAVSGKTKVRNQLYLLFRKSKIKKSIDKMKYQIPSNKLCLLEPRHYKISKDKSEYFQDFKSLIQKEKNYQWQLQQQLVQKDINNQSKDQQQLSKKKLIKSFKWIKYMANELQQKLQAEAQKSEQQTQFSRENNNQNIFIGQQYQNINSNQQQNQRYSMINQTFNQLRESMSPKKLYNLTFMQLFFQLIQMNVQNQNQNYQQLNSIQNSPLKEQRKQRSSANHGSLILTKIKENCELCKNLQGTRLCQNCAKKFHKLSTNRTSIFTGKNGGKQQKLQGSQNGKKSLQNLKKFGKNKCKIIINNYQKYFQQIKPFSPTHIFPIILDVASSAIVFFWLFCYSINLAFFDMNFSNKFYIIMLWTILFFVFEIGVRALIGIQIDTQIIHEKSFILRHYLKSQFIYDLIGLFSVITIYAISEENLPSIIAKVIFAIKIYPLTHRISRLQSLYHTHEEGSHIIQLLYLLSQVIHMCHWIGVAYHLLAELQINYMGETSTWVQSEGIEEEDWIVRYANAFYWAIATMMLIGTKGTTFVETIFTTVILLFTVGVFAYLLGSISLIIEEINKESSEYKKDIQVMNRHMRINLIDKSIQNKIRGYLEYVYQDRSYMKQNSAVKDVLQKLPDHLRKEIYSEINTSLVSKIKFFNQNFNDNIINKISQIGTEQQFVTNEQIFISQPNGEQVLYLIMNGKVQISKKGKEQHTLGILQTGSLLGELNFITGQQFDYSAKCRSFVSCLQIKRSDFLKILRKNQDEYEKFIYIKDQVSAHGYSKQFYKDCLICDQKYHNELNCPLLAYQKDVFYNYLVLKRENKVQQEREYGFERRQIVEREFFHPWNLQYELYDVYERIMQSEDFKDFLDFYDDLLGSDFGESYYSDSEESSNSSYYESEKQISEYNKMAKSLKSQKTLKSQKSIKSQKTNKSNSKLAMYQKNSMNSDLRQKADCISTKHISGNTSKLYKDPSSINQNYYTFSQSKIQNQGQEKNRSRSISVHDTQSNMSYQQNSVHTTNKNRTSFRKKSSYEVFESDIENIKELESDIYGVQEETYKQSNKYLTLNHDPNNLDEEYENSVKKNHKASFNLTANYNTQRTGYLGRKMSQNIFASPKQQFKRAQNRKRKRVRLKTLKSMKSGKSFVSGGAGYNYSPSGFRFANWQPNTMESVLQSNFEQQDITQSELDPKKFDMEFIAQLNKKIDLFFEFDSFHDFKIYYPQYNLSKLLEKYNIRFGNKIVSHNTGIMTNYQNTTYYNTANSQLKLGSNTKLYQKLKKADNTNNNNNNNNNSNSNTELNLNVNNQQNEQNE